MPLITTKKFQGFCDNKSNEVVDFANYYRCAQKSKKIFYAPHLVFKQSPKKGRFLSAVLDYNALFGNSFIGIHGDIMFLKYISVILYSKVFVYYSLMTSRRWLVERDELNVGELLSFPLPIPNSEELKRACEIYDRSSSLAIDCVKEIDGFSYELFDLKEYEIEFVDNAVSYVYDYFYAKGKSKSLSYPEEKTLKQYQNVLVDILRKSLGTLDHIHCDVYSGNAPLIVVQVVFGNDTVGFTPNVDINDLLNELDNLLISENSGCVAVKRNVRIYNKDSIYLVKPSQSRYWSYSSACRDADEIYSDIMRKWGE